MKKFIATILTTVMLLSLVFVVPASAETEIDSFKVTVVRDKFVNVEGQLVRNNSNADVSILIAQTSDSSIPPLTLAKTNPECVETMGQVKSNENGKYSFRYTMSDDAPEGICMIQTTTHSFLQIKTKTLQMQESHT